MNNPAPTDWKSAAMHKRLRKRYRAERRFPLFGLAAGVLSAAFLAFLLVTMAWNGARGFTRTEILLPIDFPALNLRVDAAQLRSPGADLALASAGLDDAVQNAEIATYYKNPCKCDPPFVRLISDSAWLK